MRILLVGSSYSVHTARWIRQLRGTSWDVHLFDPSNALIHEELEGITLHTGWKKPDVPPGTRVHYRWPFLRGRHFMARRFPALWGLIVPQADRRLARLIERLRPDCIHALGLQNYAETVLRARGVLGGTLPAPWIYSCRGSDIYYYRQFPEHGETIRGVLSGSQYLMCNCRRDVRLAEEHGFRGELLGLFQGGGGFPVSEMIEGSSPAPPSKRRVVAVKGLETLLGNALLSIEALRRCADRLRGYRLKFYQSHDATVEEARKLAAETGLDVDIVTRSNYRVIWSLFGEARLSLAVSRSDGIPNAMIESMIMGAFPVQTNPGGATAEWIEDGKNGLLVPDDDPEAVAEAVVRALTDDRMVDAAVEVNRRLAFERVDDARVRPRVLEAYRRAAGG